MTKPQVSKWSAVLLLLAAVAAGPLSEARAQVPKEGITVHGHWTIEVRDPDGTLVSRHDFDNALIGGASLARVLARDATVGLWRVFLNSLPGGLCLPEGTAGSAGCLIVEGSYPFSDPGHIFKTLTLSANGSALTLSGTATAARNDVIASVHTLYDECPATTAPATTCVSGTGVTFTRTTAVLSIPVAAGQQILVTVALTFS